MAKKQISVSTIALRMDRILDAYKEFLYNSTEENKNQSSSTTSKIFGMTKYSTRNGLESHREILNYAAYARKTIEETNENENPVSFRTRSSRCTKRGNSENAILASNIKRKVAKRRMVTNIPKTGIETDVANKKTSRRCAKKIEKKTRVENDNNQTSSPR